MGGRWGDQSANGVPREKGTPPRMPRTNGFRRGNASCLPRMGRTAGSPLLCQLLVHRRKLLQGRLKILGNLARQHIRLGQVFRVLQAVVL